MREYDKKATALAAPLMLAQLKDQTVQEGFNLACSGMQALCHGLAFNSGWWEGVDETNTYVRATKLALIHSEVSEALEGMRKDMMDDHLPHRKMEEVELADTLIRIFDYAETQGFDLGGAMVEKLIYNQSRSDHKPENRNKPTGKQV